MRSDGTETYYQKSTKAVKVFLLDNLLIEKKNVPIKDIS